MTLKLSIQIDCFPRWQSKPSSKHLSVPPITVSLNCLLNSGSWWVNLSQEPKSSDSVRHCLYTLHSSLDRLLWGQEVTPVMKTFDQGTGGQHLVTIIFEVLQIPRCTLLKDLLVFPERFPPSVEVLFFMCVRRKGRNLLAYLVQPISTVAWNGKMARHLSCRCSASWLTVLWAGPHAP